MSDDSPFSWSAMIGAMMGGGVGYSLINGYGLLHAIGMAVSFLVLGVLMWSASQAVGKARSVIA